MNLLNRKPLIEITPDVKICAFCGCEFVYVGRYRGQVKYCSQECYKAASNEKTKKHPLLALGTTQLSSHRIKDFKKEQRRIKIEKKILHL